MADNRAAISHIAQAMTPAERIAVVVRTVMLAKTVDPRMLQNTIAGMVQHAFAMGMTSVINDPDANRSPSDRFNEYMNTKPLKPE